MTGQPRIEAVTFDFWDTLIGAGSADGRRHDQWARLLREHVGDVDESALEVAMGDLWEWFQVEWEANRPVAPEQAVAWVLGRVGQPGDGPLAAAMAQVLHDGADPHLQPVAPDAAVALQRLREAGVRVGIISDVGLSPSTVLRGYLEHHDLLRWFDSWSFSDDVGCFKPDRRIFEHARASLGVSGPMAHIGDLRRTDVAGARAAGWRSVRCRAFFDDPSDLPDADVVVDSLSAAVDALLTE